MKKKLKGNKKKIAISGGVLLLVVVIVSVFALNGSSTPVFAESSVTIQDIRTYYSYEGNIEATNSQTVYATTMYNIKDMAVSEGDMVVEGQLLFTLDNDNIDTSIAQAQASLNSAQLAVNDAQINASRMSALYQEGAISTLEYEQANSSLSNAKTQLSQAQASYQSVMNQKNDTREYAKTSGEVIEICVEENESLTIGTKIMEIIDYTTLEVGVKVDEYDLGALSLGMKTEVLVNALGETVTGTVTKISQKAEVVNGVSYFPTIVTFDDPQGLRVGMSVEVRILAQNAENVLTVPVAAIQYEAKKPFVECKNESGETIKKYVEIGISNGTYVEIISGIEEGDIVMVPQGTVGSGMTEGGMTGGTAGGGAGPMRNQ